MPKKPAKPKGISSNKTYRRVLKQYKNDRDYGSALTDLTQHFLERLGLPEKTLKEAKKAELNTISRQETIRLVTKSGFIRVSELKHIVGDTSAELRSVLDSHKQKFNGEQITFFQEIDQFFNGLMPQLEKARGEVHLSKPMIRNVSYAVAIVNGATMTVLLGERADSYYNTMNRVTEHIRTQVYRE